MKKLLNRLKCLIGLHQWKREQEVFVTDTMGGRKAEVVIAWKCCERCAKSKLIHILK